MLVNAHRLSHSFAARSLFKDISFSIDSGQRIGLIGPNGSGKSTLLKILAGQIQADSGTLSLQRGLRVGWLEQVPQFIAGASVYSCVMEGSRDPQDWQEMARAEMLMSKLALNQGAVQSDTLVDQLSGGWKKRVALARELMREPDLLLLDEPTNHLDVESIQWLEDLLAIAKFATVVITHDRLFLQRVANQIFELDRRHKDGLLKVTGDYSTYLSLRAELLSAQEQKENQLRNTLRRETEWLRRGAQARQTKQQARIDKHERLNDEVAELSQRNASAQVRLDFQASENKPKRLIAAEGISKRYGENVVVPKVDLLLTPKSRIGLLGSNGCGKSTLIRLLVGGEEPDSGRVTRAEQLEVAYFEQNRESLDPALSVQNTICPLGDYVDFGAAKVHVKSYLTRFLFSYDQLDLPVGKLSGGEQSRLLIARLMLKRANVLILDEPTNDLDMATLDVLQDVLREFDGAVLLVTHDRYFLDQTTDQILAFGKNLAGEKVIEKFSSLEQWENWKSELANPGKAPRATTKTERLEQKMKKRSYKDQFELDGMEERILKLEHQLSELTAESQRPEITSDSERLLKVTQKMGETQQEIDRLYSRWAELE